MTLRSLVSLVLLFGQGALWAQDTLVFRPLDRITVVTDPGKGVRYVQHNVELPAATLPVRRIQLHLSYACPDSLRCADWDYLDHVWVRPQNSTDTFELARMLTPYGHRLASDWSFTWTTDVTEMAPILRGPVEFIHVHHGYEDAHDRGWTVTAELHYILGPPAAPVLRTDLLVKGEYALGLASDPIDPKLGPFALNAPKGATQLRLHVHQTGHDMNPSDGCGEFCAKWRSTHVNGQRVDQRSLWRACGDNPLYPQAGTWLFDRAHWCPGELQQPDRITATLPKNAHKKPVQVAFRMEPYLLDSSKARTNITAHAAWYGSPTHQHDAAITEILWPSNESRHQRPVPATTGARIVIANRGGATLRQLTIRYGAGHDTLSYAWIGVLAFDASDTVDLPIHFPNGSGSFHARVERPNGQVDAWPHDDRLTSTFRPAPVLPQQLIVRLATNAQPEHNALSIRSADGSEQLLHALGTLKADSLYSSRLHLPKGDHILCLTDTAGDGLSFWFNTQGGHGSLQVLDTLGRVLYRAEPDFGNRSEWLFRTAEVGTTPIITTPNVHLHPRLTPGPTTLHYFANEAEPLRIVVTNEASDTVLVIAPEGSIKESTIPIDLSGNPDGRYTVEVLRAGTSVFRQMMRVRREGN